MKAQEPNGFIVLPSIAKTALAVLIHTSAFQDVVRNS
jgi:hypothetical protein